MDLRELGQVRAGQARLRKLEAWKLFRYSGCTVRQRTILCQQQFKLIMSTPYDHQSLEQKWQNIWDETKSFKTPQEAASQDTAYILEMFPYPSGAGIHIGHALCYTGGDVLARFAIKQGKAVLHPMGWDAFGLPAENYAIKSGVHPAISTETNSHNFKKQIKRLGISYDWDKEITTSSLEYYRWTQWLFQFLYRRGLAYRKNGLVNWCPNDQTVLANEQVVAGLCERCGAAVIQKEMRQWYFKVTEYAERLLNDLEPLDWPEKIKAAQRNWIGKSEGVYFQFDQIKVFTTRPDTLDGATFLVLAPEHPAVKELTSPAQTEVVQQYQRQAASNSELERTFTDRPKTGVWTGSYASNPLNGEKIPVWIADYVLSSYGTGAIMAVPAYDERDRAFALLHNLPIKEIELPDTVQTEQLIHNAGGERTTTYHLRDWLVSRQRYWGVPIPMLYSDDGAEHLVAESDLPVELPSAVEFRPTGESPLRLATDWNTVIDPATGATLHREVDTLDTFVCSSWYYLRYPTPHLAEAAFSQKAVATWLPVDTYIGGAEHAVLHLLYARFITKVLFDEGLLNFNEPFTSLRNQGMILGPDHQKMSKSKGNVINPDDVITDYGADTLRVYELFMAPFDAEKPWNTSGISGSKRFLERIWNLADDVTDKVPSQAEQRLIHPLIMHVTEAIQACRFNVAIAAMMGALNDLSALPEISLSGYQALLSLLNPFAPHVTDELWQRFSTSEICSKAAWPAADPLYLVEESVVYPVQINGKVRQRITLATGLSEAEVLKAVYADPVVQRYLGQATPKRQIVISDKLVSLVV